MNLKGEMRGILAVACFLGCLPGLLGAKDSWKPALNEGKFFAIAFPQTYGAAGKCEVVITASRGAIINVEAPLAKIDDKGLHLAGGTSKRYSFPWNLRVPAGARNKYPVYITSDNYIKVEVAIISSSGEMDAFLAMPVTEESKEFMHVSYREPKTYAALLVVATEDDTDMEIYQRDHKVGMGYKRKVNVNMNRFSTYVWHMNAEMTGSIIRANKPISVISAALCSRVPPEVTNCDPVIEYLPPTYYLGRLYVVPPIAGRAHTSGYLTRVTAAYDNTKVWTYHHSSEREHTLDRGSFVDIWVNSPIPTSIECSLPCLVTVFNRGPASDGRKTDAFMMYIPSVGQMVEGMIDINTFLYTTGAEASYHMSIVAKSENTPTFMLNHRPLYIRNWLCVDGALYCNYKYANITMSHGFHSLLATSPGTKYLAWQYAHSNNNSPGTKLNGYGLATAYNLIRHFVRVKVTVKLITTLSNEEQLRIL